MKRVDPHARATPRLGARPPLVSRVPECGRYLGDNDATTPQLTCIRRMGHVGLCDNLVGDGTGWIINLTTVTPSQNVLMRAYRSKHAYAGLRDRYATELMVAMANGSIPAATARRALVITRIVRRAAWLLDRGNLVGGCKPLLDAAVLRGLIRDDKEDWLDDEYEQRVEPGGHERTVIRVWDSAPGPRPG